MEDATNPTTPDLTAIEDLQRDALAQVHSAASVAELEQIRIHWLSRKGKLTALLHGIGAQPEQLRPAYGGAVQSFRSALNQALSARTEALQQSAQKPSEASFLPPPRGLPSGTLHPITRTIDQICDWFAAQGYLVLEGMEIEDEEHNFEALNIPASHPARAMHDTFYLEDDRLLRTHTSPMQVRMMRTLAQASAGKEVDLAMVCPGKVYRCDSDVTHTPMFHQIEGLVIGKDLTFADLKGVLAAFCEELFGARPMRFRASYFPFTEPSAEVDIQCVRCDGQGCNVCSSTGWLEILGCGMVNPRVYAACGLSQDSKGFAFGLGMERIAMLLYGIEDIRLNFENDLRFLKQFNTPFFPLTLHPPQASHKS